MSRDAFNLNNQTNNTLAQLIRQYSVQQEPLQQQNISNNNMYFEINSQADLEYIVPDKSGQKQIVDCPKENKVYVGRYNHVRQIMDWQSYINEGSIKLAQESNANESMTQIAEALVAVANKLDSLQGDIHKISSHEIKSNDPIADEPKMTRRSNGQFRKKGE